VERTWLAEELLEKLGDEKCRFLLITGEPGAGKTSFAAWLAHRCPDWPRYFIRRDSRTPFKSGDARSLLLALGFQLAALRPALFQSRQLQVVVQQRIDTVTAGGEMVGVRVRELKASPFYQLSVHIQQDVHTIAGNVIGMLADQAVVGDRQLSVADLQHMALLDPAVALLREDPGARIVILIDALDELRFSSEGKSVVDWLADCPELPGNVRIVLLSRPERMLDQFRQKQGPWLKEVRIDPQSDTVRADLLL
jgi:hypothetical protein